MSATLSRMGFGMFCADKARDNKERLINQTSELDMMLYKLNKVHYRLKVCEKIINSEIE